MFSMRQFFETKIDMILKQENGLPLRHWCHQKKLILLCELIIRIGKKTFMLLDTEVSFRQGYSSPYDFFN